MQRHERKFTARRSNPYPADVILASAASSSTEFQETPSPTQERSSILSSFAKFFTNLIPTTWLSRKSVQSTRETTLNNESSRLDEEFTEQPQVDEEYVEQILKLYPQATPEEIRMASTCPSLWQIIHDAVESKKHNGNHSRIGNTDLGLSTNATVHSEFNNDIISIEDEQPSQLKSSSLGIENKTPTDVVRSMIKGTSSSNPSVVSSQQQNRAPQSAFNFPTSPIKTSGEDSQHNGHFSNTIYPIPKKRLLFPGSLNSQKKELLNPHIVRGNAKKDTTSSSKRSHESFEPQKSNVPSETDSKPTKRVKHLYPQGAKTYSETAKRILETLDQLSSPLIDVERVPPKPLAMRLSTVERTQSKLRKSTSQLDDEDIIPSSSMNDVVSTSKVESRKKYQAPVAEKKEVPKPEKPVKTTKFAPSVDEATPTKRKHIVRKDSTPYARKSKQAEPVEEEEEEEEEIFEEATREKREKLSQVPPLANFLPPTASINFTFNSTKPLTVGKLIEEKPSESKDTEMKESTTTVTTEKPITSVEPTKPTEQKKESLDETKQKEETPKEQKEEQPTPTTSLEKSQEEKPSFSFTFLAKPTDPAVKKPEVFESKKNETTISAAPAMTTEPKAITSIPDESDRSVTPVSISSSSEEEEEAPKEPSGFKFTFPTGGVSFPSATSTMTQKDESNQEKVEEHKIENERPKLSAFSSFISPPIISSKSPETTSETTATTTGFNFVKPSTSITSTKEGDSEKPQTNGGFVFTATQPASSAPSFSLSTKKTEDKKDETVAFKPPVSTSFSLSLGPPKISEEKKDSSMPTTGGFNFGGAFVPQKPIESTEEKKDTTETTGFKFTGSATPSFSVTSSPPEKKDEPTSFAPNISFGSSNKTSELKSSFSFGGASTGGDKPTSSGMSFSFGGATVPSVPTSTPVNFSFGSSVPKEEPAKALEDKPQTEQAIKPAFSGVGSFSFNKPSSDNTSTGSGGNEKASIAPSSFSFGSIAKQSDSSSITPTSNVGFSFGAPSTGAASPPTSVTSAESKPLTSFTFGTTPSDTASNDTKSTFSFGGSSIQTTATDTSKPSLSFSSGGFSFGAKPAAQEAPSSGAQTENKFVFGAQNNQPPTSTGFTFGLGTQPTVATSFSFNAPSQPTTTAPSFGGNSMLEDDSAMHQSGMNFPSSTLSFTQPAAFSAITPTTPSISPFGPPQTNNFSSGMANPFNASAAQPEFPDQRKPIKALRRRK